jgi:hypothetical protein
MRCHGITVRLKLDTAGTGHSVTWGLGDRGLMQVRPFSGARDAVATDRARLAAAGAAKQLGSRGIRDPKPEPALVRRSPSFSVAWGSWRAATILRMGAMSLMRTITAFGACYRRLALRTRKATAIAATARTLAVVIYRTLEGEIVYHDPGADGDDPQQRTRAPRQIRRRAAASSSYSTAPMVRYPPNLQKFLGGRTSAALKGRPYIDPVPGPQSPVPGAGL